FQVFSEPGTPLAALVSNGQYVIVLNSKGTTVKLVSVTDGSTIQTMKIRKTAQQNSKLLVYNFYNDANEEIVVATRRNTTVKLSALSLSVDHKLTKGKTLSKTVKAKSIKLKRKANNVLVKQVSAVVLKARVQTTATLQVI
ncbi:MAG: hypothetical protein WCV88_01105, partial [Patescibacteria group bacterium]